MQWRDDCLEVTAPKRPKKLTGTRFATILGLNPWSTPFEIWCEVTRTYSSPFEENKYTRAGKVIEPKLIEYMRRVYMLDNIKTPTDIYGEDYFKKTWGDFFPEHPFLGGMWDGLLYEDGVPTTVLEFKTTKRAEDWMNGAPEYYALQAALYAYLLGVDEVIMVASFLEESDYESPESFVPSSNNTIIDEFLVSERFPHFQAHVDRVTEWWERYVTTGISPPFDERKDADILKELRKNNVEADDDILSLIAEGEKLTQQIALIKQNELDEKEKRLKEITEAVKSHAVKQFRDGDTRVAITGKVYEWVVSKSVSSEIDKTRLKKDGLLEKYSKPKESFRITQTAIGE